MGYHLDGRLIFLGLAAFSALKAAFSSFYILSSSRMSPSAYFRGSAFFASRARAFALESFTDPFSFVLGGGFCGEVLAPVESYFLWRVVTLEVICLKS